MTKKNGTRTIVINGDITIDWNIVRIKRMEEMGKAWNADDLTTTFCQRGGVILLADLVTAIAGNLKQIKGIKVDIRQPVIPGDVITPDDKRFHHSYAVWAPFKRDEGKSGPSDKVWRVQEFLGLYPAHKEAAAEAECRRFADDPESADLVILDDANLGFRDNPDCWPHALVSGKIRPWVLVKMAKPVAQGTLWEYLLKSHTDRLIVLMTANDLRSTAVQISCQVSWERTAQDLVWELLYNHHVNSLSLCEHVIVSFGPSGAVLLSRNASGPPQATLFFDPNAMEGEWGNQHKGYMIGFSTCLAGGLAREILLDSKKPDMSQGIQSSVCAMRYIQEAGYGPVGGEPGKISMAFPADRIAEQLSKEGRCLAAVPIKIPIHRLKENIPGTVREFWTILDQSYPGPLEHVAKEIVINGLESSLSGVPIEQFHDLKTPDRKEIEAFHNIGGLIKEYCERRQQKPLSIAVFGPPGAGKSFAVTEVASSARQDDIDSITFNLSQFKSPDDLIDAFHQIRDKALKGKIPLVFWDEFDTTFQIQPLGWLRYFLAPMNDGEFQEGQIIHPIGRSIFVFAGGTSHSIEDFIANSGKEDYRSAKLPDFISRLKGSLNILGPNRQDVGPHNTDGTFIIRRAIILRSVFKRFAPQIVHSESGKKIIHIDPGLLRAFLLIKEYRHGARSIEAIVSMSRLAGKTTFERSSLPTEVQLNLHLDGREFYILMRQLEFDREALEKLAEATHDVFCEDLRAKGYKWGPKTDDAKKVHSSLKPFSELPEDEHEQNRNFVRDIPNKLNHTGFTMLPVSSGKTSDQMCDEQIETMAKMEHERWVKQKLDAGWKYAPETDKARKLHKDLVPWEDLSEEDKEKDRVLVRNIPRILEKAGYVMVKVGQES